MEAIHDKPDGGWGWIVTFVAFTVGLMLDGISFSFGILFTELLIYFNQSKSLTSWIISVYNGATLFIGPVAQVLISWFGMRRVAVSGAVLACISMFLSTFSPNIQVMIILYGLMGGCGLGLIYFPSIVLIGHYFTSKRGLASGIAYCGSGVGGFIFAPLTDVLITKYSWKGAVWIISAVVLNLVPLGALLRPLKLPENDNTSKKESNIGSVVPQSNCACIYSTFSEFKLLKSPLLLVYGSSCFLCSIGFYIPFTFLPDLVESFGMTSQEGAILIAIIGISNTVGRVAAGWLADRSWADPIKLNSVWLILGGAASLFVTKYIIYLPLAVYCGVFGLSIGVFTTCQPIISLELSGTEQMAPFYSIVCLLQGLSSMVGAPIAGMLADTAGNYNGAFYMAGTTIALAGIICLPLKCIQRWKLRRLEQTRAYGEFSAENSNNLAESIHM